MTADEDGREERDPARDGLREGDPARRPRSKERDTAVRRGGDSVKTEAWAAKGEAQRERYDGEERGRLRQDLGVGCERRGTEREIRRRGEAGESCETEAWAAKGEAQRERYGGEERRESPVRLDRRRQAVGRESPGRRRREEGFRFFFFFDGRE
ncbi:hypothetical protein F2Q69_00050890 [Brassica cretica]|uniref:Uncharacterized protein n=1 Tax=Brassica cretica TaxID=69181 RepID=A0A8S9Q0X6_BRACR|nr:hypothetical protein F2Q69_00050890 [Brassica cretica]